MTGHHDTTTEPCRAAGRQPGRAGLLEGEAVAASTTVVRAIAAAPPAARTGCVT
jgi:hypothetical protein